MFNGGNWDQWIPAKTTTAHGAHAARQTFRFIMRWPMRSPSATATTARCSVRPTPIATTCGPAGTATTARDGGPVIANDEIGYGWQTYPERLQDAGVSWKIYQDHRRRSRRRSRLGLGTGRLHRQLWRQLAAVLPQLPERPSRQPAVPSAPAPGRTSATAAASSTSSPPTSRTTSCRACPGSSPLRPTPSTRRGPPATARGTRPRVLNALTSNPDVWSKTALLITFDENDGFFDHVVAPYPNVGGSSRPVDRAA